VFTVVAKALENWAPKPFDHIVIDEAQDLAPAELRFFAALAPNGLDGLFLSGDAGQRIFQHPYSWTSLGVDVRGRSHTLKVCYRTSQQIRRAADRLLPNGVARSGRLEDERRGIVSVFEGPRPDVKSFPSVEEEAKYVRDTVAGWLGDGMAAQEIGLFMWTQDLVPRARNAIDGLAGADGVTTAPMSLAKGPEFRAVVVMACDEGILPLDERVSHQN
jgi:superfamily I DNA/RNA helicase